MLDASSSPPRLPPTLLHGLTTQLESQPEAPALSFLGESGRLEHEVSYQALCSRATVVADWLTDRHARGERALLLFPAGIEFSVAFIRAPSSFPTSRANIHQRSSHARTPRVAQVSA